jgi:hypothetical protein
MPSTDLRAEFARECEHWKSAAERLADVDVVAPAPAWHALEHYLGVSLRGSLRAVVDRVLRLVAGVERQLAAGGLPDDRCSSSSSRCVRRISAPKRRWISTPTR